MGSDIKQVREKALRTGARKSSMLIYRFAHLLLRKLVNPYLSVRSENSDHLNLEGATILTPVHRSHLDSILLASLSKRRIRAMGKESLFKVPVLGYVCAALGAVPIRRGQAAKDAMGAIKKLLDAGESVIVFPEGGRQKGSQVCELFDGAAWLASRTNARVIPVGIAGTEAVLPEGGKMLRRSKVAIMVGEPLEPPKSANGKPPTREELAVYTQNLQTAIQQAQDKAEELRQGN